MAKDKKFQSWTEYANIIVPFLGPLAFEVSNSVTGDWFDENKKFILSTGKVITILIGIIYIMVMIYLLYHSETQKKGIDSLQKELEEQKKKSKAYQKSNETVCTLLAYLRDKIKEQIDFLKEHDKIDVRNLNINSASATICKIIYQNIIENSGEDVKVTVNMYDKINREGIEYSIMIAHEGHASQPDAFGVSRLLKPDKNKCRFCEKILMSNSPDYRILLNKKDVAKAFGLVTTKCKYNQYLGIPIRKKGGTNIALIEIVAHNDTVIWKDEDAARQFATNYCEIQKEYILLMDRMYEQGETIASKLDKGGI